MLGCALLSPSYAIYELFNHLAANHFLLALEADGEFGQIIIRFTGIETDTVDKVGARRLDA